MLENSLWTHSEFTAELELPCLAPCPDVMLVGTTTEISKTQSVLLPVFQVRKFSPKYSAENFSAGIAKVKGGGKKKNLIYSNPGRHQWNDVLSLLSHFLSIKLSLHTTTLFSFRSLLFRSCIMLVITRILKHTWKLKENTGKMSVCKS